MAQPQTIDEAIDRNAKGPASVTVAGETTTVKDIDQLIKADKHLAAKRAKANGNLGVMFGKIVPGGTG
jgi:hypothetical protein